MSVKRDTNEAKNGLGKHCFTPRSIGKFEVGDNAEWSSALTLLQSRVEALENRQQPSCVEDEPDALTCWFRDAPDGVASAGTMVVATVTDPQAAVVMGPMTMVAATAMDPQEKLKDKCVAGDKEKLKDKLDAGLKERIETAVQDALDRLDEDQLAKKVEFEAKQKEFMGVVNPILLGAGIDGLNDLALTADLRCLGC